MKKVMTILYLALAVAMAACADAARADEQHSRPQGMSLRLELFVSDLQKSVEFYTRVLGFERLEGQADYVPVRSGSVVFGLGPAENLSKRHYFNPELQTARRGLGAEIVLEVDDVQAFFAKVKASGYKQIVSPLRAQSWGLTDFRVADPDGYYLRITSR